VRHDVRRRTPPPQGFCTVQGVPGEECWVLASQPIERPPILGTFTTHQNGGWRYHE